MSKRAKWVELAAKQGNTKAEGALGDLYLRGLGVHQDDQMAAAWLERAANKNYVTAQTELGVLYLMGQGVPHDDAIAAAWLTKAAEQGNQGAQANLASLYEHGRGVSLDLKRAYVWRLLSLDESTPKPSHELQKLARLMSAEDVAAAERQASEWRQLHLATHSSEDDSAIIPIPLVKASR